MACEEKSQWIAGHVDDLKMQLRQTQQGTLTRHARIPHVDVINHLVPCRFLFIIGNDGKLSEFHEQTSFHVSSHSKGTATGIV